MRKLGLAEALPVGGWRVVPIVLTEIQASPVNGWTSFYASKEPYAVLLVDGGGEGIALDIEGRDISVSHLLEQVPELAVILTDSPKAGTSDDDSVSNGSRE